jgi:MFS family permease
MNRKIMFGILGGLLGFIGGTLIGGYIGLVIGGNFLWCLDLHERIGIEGYALGLYIGAVLGAIGASIYGAKYMIKKTTKE